MEHDQASTLPNLSVSVFPTPNAQRAARLVGEGGGILEII